MENGIIKILIPAVGGQGGGVLSEWLYKAFLVEGYDVQGISLPGLAQRGGSTVYYLEAFKDAGNNKVVFSQFPMQGDVDVILSQEFLELGRILELGYGSKKTRIVSSTHRIYSTLEKLPVGSGIYSDDNLTDIANEFSSRFIGVNTIDIARKSGLDELSTNAILLGVLCASRSVPVSKESFIKSIEEIGVSKDVNLNAFEIGYKYVIENEIRSGNDVHDDKFPEQFSELNLFQRNKLNNIMKIIEKSYPKNILQLLFEAVTRLTDYQGIDFVEEYLKSVERISAIDRENPTKKYILTETFLKNLALLMSYEDGIRVAELKIRSNRFKRIREEMSIEKDQLYEVIDYLKPEAEEVYGLLPYKIVNPFVVFVNSNVFKKIWKKEDPVTIAQTPKTTSFFGFLGLWMLSKIKFLRPYSYRFKKEEHVFKRYIEELERYANYDYELGLIVAKSAGMIKGYGKVRRRTVQAFNRFLDNVIDPLFLHEVSKQQGFILTKEIGLKSLQLISEGEEGIDTSEKLAMDALNS